jgi:mono/diheme cytochrome c family protein
MARKQLAAIAILAALGGQAAAADVVRGGQTYAMHCAMCHGPAGQGVHPLAPKFNRGERLLQSDMALLNTIRSGKNAMPPFMGVLRDREILDAISFVRTLQR